MEVKENYAKQRLYVNYFPIKKGGLYRIVKEGKDYISVKCRGKIINVPRAFLEEDESEIQEISEIDELEYIENQESN